MPNNYNSWQKSNAPPWLGQPYGQQWVGAHGAVKDALVAQLKQSVKVRFPLVAPPDALQLLGNERSIIRGINESNTAYAGRVQRAWDSWQWGGTAFGILSQLYAIGYTSTVIVSRGILYSLNAAGQLNTPTVQPAGRNPYWSTFAVIVPHPFPSAWMVGAVWQTIYQIGSGVGLLTMSGTQAVDSQVIVKIVNGGAIGTATFQYSTDPLGLTFSGAATLNSSNSLAGGAAGLTLNAFSGPFVTGNYYFFSLSVPVDGGPDSNLFRAVISAFKPATTRCQSITILQSGKLLGYPQRNLGSATDGVIGGCATTQWAPPSN